MKKVTTRLAFHRVTVRTLSDDRLKSVGGADLPTGATCNTCVHDCVMKSPTYTYRCNE